MNISGASAVGLLESTMTARKSREEMSVAVLEKAQDVMKQQGEAIVRLVEDSGTAPDPGRPPNSGRFEALA